MLSLCDKSLFPSSIERKSIVTRHFAASDVTNDTPKNSRVIEIRYDIYYIRSPSL